MYIHVGGILDVADEFLNRDGCCGSGTVCRPTDVENAYEWSSLGGAT